MSVEVGGNGSLFQCTDPTFSENTIKIMKMLSGQSVTWPISEYFKT